MLEIWKFTVSTEDVGNTERKAVVQGKVDGSWSKFGEKVWERTLGENFGRERIIYTEESRRSF